jgi:hypothetical protein
MSSRRRHIANHQKPRTRTDGPPRPTPLDVVIGQHHGSTVALEATPDRLQTAKNKPIPSLSERIEQLSTENGHLRHEMFYYQRMHDATRDFQEDVKQVLEKLRRAVSRFKGAQRRVDEDWVRMQNSDAYVWRGRSG